MPSAEDTTSSTVSPPAGSSNSAQTPEEFAVEPHQEANVPGPSAAPSVAPSPIELDAKPSPEESPSEPAEDEASPLRTKPLPRVSAVSREVRVKATGARAGNVTAERELFTESTTTVLVFEKGAVIHLTAAVAPGQLLFLTNEETKREVVTQVIRKRTYRPTECYVELEFAVSAPGFWGMEFSAATALLPKDAKELAAAEMVASAETTADELEEAAPPPSAEEVEALKKEVEALRSQLQLLQPQMEPGQLPPDAPVSNAPPATPASTAILHEEVTNALAKSAPNLASLAKAPVAATTTELPWINPADQELPKRALDFHIPVPKRKRSFRARGQFTPGFRTGMLRLAVLSTILAGLLGTVWYKRWLPWMRAPEKISVASWAGGVTTSVAGSEGQPRGAISVNPQNARPNTENSGTVSVKETSPGPARSGKAPAAEVASGNENDAVSSQPYEVIERPAAPEKKLPPESIAKPSPIYTTSAKADNPAPTPASVGSSNLVPPKLIKSERAVASLEDLRDFETGSVIIDAIIDTEGNVTSPRVLSGPPSLRWPAMRAVKNYKYEPAMQNGGPVAAHVTVKIQFHFE